MDNSLSKLQFVNSLSKIQFVNSLSKMTECSFSYLFIVLDCNYLLFMIFLIAIVYSVIQKLP